MEFRERFNYYFLNAKTSQQKAEFRISKPDILKNNLDNKKLRVQKFYLNNTAIPIFIPQRLTPYNSVEYYATTTNATNLTTGINTTLDIDSLKYYVIVRDITNTFAIIYYLKHIPMQSPISAPPPLTPITDDYTYYTNKYYYYNDFTYFLELVRDAIKAAWSAHPLHGSTNDVEPILWQNKGGFFQLFIQNSASWSIDFSESLINILPFKNILTSDGHYRLIFDTVPATINGANYYEVDADFYDTIFPFTELLFKSEDGNIDPINFINNIALSSNSNQGFFENNILSYDIATNAFNGIYNFYKYVNENDTDFVNFKSEKEIKDHLTIQLFLRMKNDIVIPYMLNPSEICKFTLEVKYDENKK